MNSLLAAMSKHKILVGLPLIITRRAADLRGFHFGKILRSKEKFGICFRGEIILHTTSFWRIINGNDVIVSRDDLWVPTLKNPWTENWDYSKGNMQDELIKKLFPKHRTIDGSDYAKNLLVTHSSLKRNNDLHIGLNRGYRIEIFNNRCEESVRLIDYKLNKHYVIGQKDGGS
jgi:hypothetical protein